jgi:hypothetical protein
MQIVQISDTHLSRDKPIFVKNWALLGTWIEQHPSPPPDGRTRNPLVGSPGNHDIGDARHAHPSMPAGFTRGSVISAQISRSKMSQRVRSAGV